MPRQVPGGGAALSDLKGEKQPVWDVPVRLVHWLLVALIAFSWWSVHNHHTDWHIWSGCAIMTLLIFRILWGFVGSSTARFASFVRGPRAIMDYWRGGWSGIGHSPIGALSVLALLASVAVQVGLGLVAEDEDGIYMGPLARLVSIETSDKARDIHELWFNFVIGFIALHLVAIIYYEVRGKRLISPMISGRGRLEPKVEPIKSGNWALAAICLVIGLAVTGWVVAGAPPF